MSRGIITDKLKSYSAAKGFRYSYKRSGVGLKGPAVMQLNPLQLFD
jgi:hypothetical protein